MYSLSEDYQSSYAPLAVSHNLPWLPEHDDPVTFVYPSEMCAALGFLLLLLLLLL